MVTTATPISRGERGGTQRTPRRPGRHRGRTAPTEAAAGRRSACSPVLGALSESLRDHSPLAIRPAGDVDHGVHPL